MGLQYDLEQQKKELEKYSHGLEELVIERTKDLRVSEQRYRALFDNATDGIVLLDKDGIIINVNNRTCEMHGYTHEELFGRHVWDLEPHGDRSVQRNNMERLLAGESLVFEAVQLKKDGTRIPLEISSKAITIADKLYIQSFYRDITEKKKTQEFLFQSQKMDSIGALAGNIAHDFSNILTAIIGHTEVIRLFPSLDRKSLRSLQVIEDSSRKAGVMISKLLGFARKSASEFLPLNLNDVIHNTLSLLEKQVGGKVLLRLELDQDVPLIKGDFNQLEQVIMNLIINARDAMPNGGALTLSTRYLEITESVQEGVPSFVPAGEYVQFNIADTGSGMSESIRQRIFEPFFTTKEQGKGTGLGLSMVYGAIKEHNGFITVESEPGAGTVFIIYIPVSHGAAPSASNSAERPPRGDETILFVDDEEDILTAAHEILTASGYTVFPSSDPAAALDIVKKKECKIDLIITDMVMPQLDGKEFVRQVREIEPEMKILAMSGYMKYVAEKADIKHIDGFLQKPFESIRLLTAVRRVIDKRHHGFLDA